MSFTDYRLPQILDSKKVCFKPPKHAKVKLYSTLIGLFTFQQLKANFTVTINFTMVYTQWAERSHLTVQLILLFRLSSPFEILLNPQEKLSIFATFNLVKRLVPRSQCCSKTHIFENGQLSGKERDTTELNFLSVQVQLRVKVKLTQLYTQDSKKNRAFSLFSQNPFLLVAPPIFIENFTPLLLFNFGDPIPQ